MNSSLCWAIVANNKPTRQGKDVTDVPYTKFIPNLHCSRPSCTVVLSSKIESRDDGHMLFVWVSHIFYGHGKQQLPVHYKDLWTIIYGPIMDDSYLKFIRGELERDAFVSFSHEDSIPSIIRSSTGLNLRIGYKISRF